MKQLISFLVTALVTGTLFLSSTGLAAKKKVTVKDDNAKVAQVAKKKKSKVAKKKKAKEPKLAASASSKWNVVCQELLDDSVNATLQLEKSVNKKKKISKSEFDEQIQNELLVVQLNAWVCALSTRDKPGIAAEELFLKDFSELVQTKRL